MRQLSKTEIEWVLETLREETRRIDAEPINGWKPYILSKAEAVKLTQKFQDEYNRRI